jgi:hypothetical protein
VRRAAVALLLVLALPAEAGAKGDVAITVCGASGCAPVEGSAGVRIALAEPRSESVPPPPVGGFYSLRFAGNGEPGVAYYVPEGRLLATIDDAGDRTGVEGVATWTRVPTAGADALARTVRGLRPFGEPVVTGAEVGYESVDDPSGYLGLFELGARGAAVPARLDWKPVVLTADRPNPWTDGTRLAYSPSGKVLRRGQELVRLPDAVVADLEARAPLAAGAGGESRWKGALVGGAAALAVVGVVAVVRGARRALRRPSPAAR